jgi:hypothetical protein
MIVVIVVQHGATPQCSEKTQFTLPTGREVPLVSLPDAISRDHRMNRQSVN